MGRQLRRRQLLSAGTDAHFARAGLRRSERERVPGEIAKFGIWCTPATGVTLQPGQSIDGAVTLRPGAGGPPDYR